jgi:CRISPR-associated protein Csb2
MLAMEIIYLTGRVTSKRIDEDGEVEFPPDWVRVYYSLAAAYFEAGEPAQERDILRWLEEVGPPEIMAPLPAGSSRVMDAFVPVNDQTGHGPFSEQRRREGRRFTSLWLGLDRARVVYVWRNAALPGNRLSVLQGLCSRVAAIGHSSSMVRLIAMDREPEISEDMVTWQPAQHGQDVFRIPFPGLLDQLPGFHDRYCRTALRGKLPAVPHPYRRGGDTGPAVALFGRSGGFQPFWTLRLVQGPPVPGLTGPFLANSLRKAILAKWQELHGNIPELVSGHTPGGGALDRPHMACVALPAVGHRYSAGHIVALAVTLPRDAPRDLEDRLISTLQSIHFLQTTGGRWELEFIGRAHPSDAPISALSSRWAGPSQTWASVTAVVLDRHPNRLFSEETKRYLAAACERLGVPQPVSVSVQPASAVPGVPLARNFPPYDKAPTAPRVHAVLRFSEPITGPLLLGRGKHCGLGLFVPWRDGSDAS